MAQLPWSQLGVFFGETAGESALADVATIGAETLLTAFPEIAAVMAIGLLGYAAIDQLWDIYHAQNPSTSIPRPGHPSPTTEKLGQPGKSYQVRWQLQSDNGYNAGTYTTGHAFVAPISIKQVRVPNFPGQPDYPGQVWIVGADLTQIVAQAAYIGQYGAWVDGTIIDLIPADGGSVRDVPVVPHYPWNPHILSPSDLALPDVTLPSLPGLTIHPQVLLPGVTLDAPGLPGTVDRRNEISIALPEAGIQVSLSPAGMSIDQVLPSGTAVLDIPKVSPWALPAAIAAAAESICDCAPPSAGGHDCATAEDVQAVGDKVDAVKTELDQVKADLEPTYSYQTALIGSNSGVFALNQIADWVEVKITAYPVNTREQNNPGLEPTLWLGYISFTSQSLAAGERTLISSASFGIKVPEGANWVIVQLYQGVVGGTYLTWKTRTN
jgi:hypothetical protein